jgi:hypothetical protein
MQRCSLYCLSRRIDRAGFLVVSEGIRIPGQKGTIYNIRCYYATIGSFCQRAIHGTLFHSKLWLCCVSLIETSRVSPTLTVTSSTVLSQTTLKRSDDVGHPGSDQKSVALWTLACTYIRQKSSVQRRTTVLQYCRPVKIHRLKGFSQCLIFSSKLLRGLPDEYFRNPKPGIFSTLLGVVRNTIQLLICRRISKRTY